MAVLRCGLPLNPCRASARWLRAQVMRMLERRPPVGPVGCVAVGLSLPSHAMHQHATRASVQ